MMHDSMPYDPIQGSSRETLKVEIPTFSMSLLPLKNGADK